MAEYNEYTIKNDTSFKYHLPNVGHSGVTSVAVGLGVGVGVGVISVLTGGLAVGIGAAVGAGIGVATGAGSLATMMGLNYFDNFSKSYFAKMEREQDAEAVLKLIKDNVQHARTIDFMLQNQPNIDKFEYLGEVLSRRKLLKLKKRHETIAYYGLKYELDIALKSSDIIVSLRDKSNRTSKENLDLANSENKLELIKQCIRDANWGHDDELHLLESRGMYTPTTSPYKELLINAIRKGCLLGPEGTTINDQIYILSRNNNGTDMESTTAEKIYSLMYEKPVLESLEKAKNLQIKAKEEVVADYEKNLQLIDELINLDAKDIKLTKKIRNLKNKIQNLTDYIALIKQSNSLTARMPSTMSADQTGLHNLAENLRQAMANENNDRARSYATDLRLKIQEVERKIDTYNYNKGRQEIQSQFNEIITLTKSSLDSTANVLIVTLANYSKTNVEMAKKLRKLNQYRNAQNLKATQLSAYNQLVQEVSNNLRSLYNDQVSTNSELSTKLDASTLAVQGLTADNTQLAQTITSLESAEQDLIRRLKVLGNRVKELKNVNEQDRANFETAETEISGYLRGLQSSKHFLETIRDLQSERIADLVEQNATAKEGEAKAKRARAKAERTSRKDRLLRTQAEEDRDIAEAEAEATRQENAGLKRDNTTLEIMHQNDQASMRETGEVLGALTEENTKLRKKKSQLHKTNSKQKARIARQDQEISTLQEQNDGMQAQIDALQEESRKQSTTIKNQRGIIASQKGQYAISKQRIADDEREIEIQQYWIDQLGAQIEDINYNLNTSLGDTERLRQDNARLSQDNESLRQERDSLELDFENAADELLATSKALGELEEILQKDEDAKKQRTKNMQEGKIRGILHRRIGKIQAHIAQVEYDMRHGKFDAETYMSIYDGKLKLDTIISSIPSYDNRKSIPIEEIETISANLDASYKEVSKNWPKFKSTVEERDSKYKIDTSGYDR